MKIVVEVYEGFVHFWGMITVCLFANMFTLSKTRFAKDFSVGSEIQDWSVIRVIWQSGWSKLISGRQKGKTCG